ncbi:hypothetical protein GCM10027048_18470 [Hymenobacter coalescens]
MRLTQSSYLLLAGLLAVGCEEKEKPTPEAATADFTYTGALQHATPLQFASQAPGASTYDWSFGDGTNSTEANPTHVFRRAGSYAVRLRTNGRLGAAEASKTLVVAQADTLTPLLNKVAGRYRFNKVIERTYAGAPPVNLVRRLADTTMTVTQNRAAGQISIHTYTLPLQAGSVPWTNIGSAPSYLFYAGTASTYGLVKAQMQSDSLIFEWRRGGLGGGTTRTYYGSKLP